MLHTKEPSLFASTTSIATVPPVQTVWQALPIMSEFVQKQHIFWLAVINTAVEHSMKKEKVTTECIHPLERPDDTGAISLVMLIVQENLDFQSERQSRESVMLSQEVSSRQQCPREVGFNLWCLIAELPLWLHGSYYPT